MHLRLACERGCTLSGLVDDKDKGGLVALAGMT
jgi:hypothetical protein